MGDPRLQSAPAADPQPATPAGPAPAAVLAADGSIPAAAQVPESEDELGIRAPLGEMAVARVTVEGKLRELRPNQVGVFERVPATARTPMPVEISYPEGQPDQEVAVAVEDGGGIDNQAALRLLRLDAQLKVSFKFNPGGSNGVYRVRLRKGVDQKTFEVWVGPPLKLAGQ